VGFEHALNLLLAVPFLVWQNTQYEDILTIISSKYSNHIFHVIFLQILKKLQILKRNVSTGIQPYMFSFVDTEHEIFFQSLTPINLTCLFK